VRRRWAACLLLACVTAGCGLLPREEEEAAPILMTPVRSERQTYTVHRGDITEAVVLRGRFAPERQAGLYFTNGGRLQALHVRGGESVKAGQVLAELHNEESAYQAAQAEIRYRKAIVALEDARYKAQFTQNPEVHSAVTLRELEVESARLEMGRWEQVLAGSRLVAPFDGQVIAVAAKPGDQVNPFEPVVTIADPSRLIVEADIDDAGLARVAVGQPALLDFPELGANGRGTVVELPASTARATDPTGQPKRIRVAVEGPQANLSMGAVGRVHVILQQKTGVLLLANSAIRQYGGRTYVVLANPRREVDVVLGIAGEAETEILRGLREGDEVLGR
jgi:macrolide-specific efflux system membrane fusion protein